MIWPNVRLVEVLDRDAAQHKLRTSFTLPNGEECRDSATMRIHQATISDGYYRELVWPANATAQDVAAWVLRLEQLRLWGLL